MATVQMYTTRWCGYCVRAKTLLEARGIEFEEISLDDDPASAAGCSTSPAAGRCRRS